MTVEPISSMMTIQAQPIQPVKEASQSSAQNNGTAKPAAEFTEGSAQGAPEVDAKTLVVNNTTKAETNGDGGQSLAKNAEQNHEEVVKALDNAKDLQDQTNDKIKRAVEDMNKRMFNSEAQFGIHEGTNRVTIKIVDKETKEVIKELPPEKTLDMIAKAWEMAGLMVDERR